MGIGTRVAILRQRKSSKRTRKLLRRQERLSAVVVVVEVVMAEIVVVVVGVGGSHQHHHHLPPLLAVPVRRLGPPSCSRQANRAAMRLRCCVVQAHRALLLLMRPDGRHDHDYDE